MTTQPDECRARDDEIIARLKAEASPRRPELPLEPRTMTELALLPEFTPELLQRTGIADKIPGQTAGLLANRDFFDSRPTIPLDDGTRQSVFWVRREARSSIGIQARQELTVELYVLLAELQGRVQRTQDQQDVGLSGWLEAVALVLRDRRGGHFLQAVANATAQGGSRLVNILATLAEVLGGSLPSVVDRARTNVAVKFRQVEAERALKHYQHREHLERWIAEALRDDERWAIHLRGDGGMGKTMLLRHVASLGFAEAHDLAPFVVAGVDFDHLDPRYPMLRPLLLFEALQSQLVMPPDVPTSEVGIARERFLDAAESATEAATGDVDTAWDPVANGIEAFAELVRLTGQQIVLVFDTAEELAKAEGGPHEGSPVEATLSRLQELQAVLRTRRQRPVRVIFAGRRPLRTTDDGSDDTPPFVQSREIPGFDAQTARDYLSERVRGIEDATAQAIMDRSRVSVTDGVEMFNPFELATLASWVLDEKEAGTTLDVAALMSGKDPYVQHRILGRVTQPAVRAVVAPAAFLGRFDRRFLAPSAQRAGIDQRSAIHALAQQEWVSVISRDEFGFPVELEVNEHLQERLQRAVEDSSDLFPLDRRLLAEDVRKEIAGRRLVGQATDPFIALVRLLSSSDALTFWGEFERRVAREQAWTWAEQLIRRLEPHAEQRPQLLTAMLATKALCASRQPAGQATADGLWRAVADLAAALPETDGAVLGARARLALVGRGAVPQDLDVLTAPVAAVAGAVAAVVGSDARTWGQTKDTVWFATALSRLDESGGHVGRSLAALGDARQGGTHRVSGYDDLLHFAIDLAQSSDERIITKETADWVDWSPPVGLVERCALGALSWDPPPGIDLSEGAWDSLARRARARLSEVDAERFLAAYLVRRLDDGLANTDELKDLEYIDGVAYSPDRKPVWELHREQPRLVDVVALGWAGFGRPGHAEDTLRTRIERAVSTGADSDSVADAQAALMRLFREYRVDPSGWSLGEMLAPGLAELEEAVRLTGAGSRGLRMSQRSKSGESPRNPQARDRLGLHASSLRLLELRALDRPQMAAGELFELGQHPVHGQEIRADMAWVLGVLACARAGVAVPKEHAERPLRSDAFLDPASLGGKWAGEWELRLRFARAYTRGAHEEAASIAEDHPSPELELATSLGEPTLSDPGAEPVDTPLQRGLRPLGRVRFKPSTAAVAVSVYAALTYGLAAVSVLILSESLPWWISLLVGLAVGWSAFSWIKSWFTRSNTSGRLTFARHSFLRVDHPGQGPVAQLEPTSGGGPQRFRQMSPFAASLYRASKTLHGRSSRRPAMVVLPESPDGSVSFSPPDWHMPHRSWAFGPEVVELDVSPLVSTMPWEHWLAATVRRSKHTFVWIRTCPGWPEALPPNGRPLFAGPDHLMTVKHRRFAVATSGGSRVSTVQTGGEEGSRPSGRLVHLVGAPVRTPAGWRLRIDQTDPYSMSYSRGTSPRRSNLVAPTDLPAAAVVILQASPIALRAQPFPTDRGGWLSFAVDTIEAGAAAVLTVPPLDDTEAKDAVDLTTKWALSLPDDMQPNNVLGLLVDLSRMVDQAVEGSEHLQHPRARDDVIGFIRLNDETSDY